jgi:glutathione S-transferase
MRVDEGPFPATDRVPAAHDGPLFELGAIGRTLDDLSPAQKGEPRRGARAKLIWVAAAVLALVAFMGWLLVSR